MNHPHSSFTENKRPPADAALKHLILNEPRSAVSKLRDLATNADSKSRTERLTFLAQLERVFTQDNWHELSTTCWNSLLEEGLPQLVIEILCKEMEPSATTHTHLACILAVASQYFKTAKIGGSQKCLSIFMDHANVIVDAVWPYRQDLEAKTWTPLGQLTSLLGREIANSHGVPRIFNPEKPINALVFNAWLFAIPDPTIDQCTTLMLHQASPKDLAHFIQKFVIDDGKVFALRCKLRDAFKTVIEERLEWLLGITSKLARNLTLKLEMIAERADVKLVIACNRQLDQGHREFDGNIFYLAVLLIYELLYRLDPVQDPRMAAIIGNNVFRFLARISILSAQLTKEDHDSVNILKKILETHIRHGEGLIDTDSDQDDSSPYKNFRTRFSHYLVIVVSELRALPMTQTTETLLDAWLKIASALGVDEPKEVRGVDPSSVCSWIECHGLDRLEKMMNCSRCKLAKYCGSNCQRRDWIEGGHKGKCRA